MDIGGDPGDIRSSARLVRRWADQVEEQAARVLGAQGVDWESTAADAFRQRIAERHRDSIAVAQRVRDAADRLDRLADALEERQSTITRLLARAGATWDQAQDHVIDKGGDLLDAARRLADDAAKLAREAL